MGCFLGFDTSNYTTSAAFCSGRGEIRQSKRVLQVKAGGKGLQQSEAVFQHVKNMPEICKAVLQDSEPPSAVGASLRPRDSEDSYMPCFKVGEMAGQIAASAFKVPFYGFSHQSGHIMAALFSAGVPELLHREFIAFHVSGGTTEALHVRPSDGLFTARVVGRSLDLKAGQAVDRAGVMLGLSFPCGHELEKLALKSTKQFNINPCVKGLDCCLSGVENQCGKMLASGCPREDVARFCIEYILRTLDKMTEAVLAEYPGLPLLYAGGVMSDGIIKDFFQQKYGAYFAAPEFSCDNAAGIALLAKCKVEGI